VIVSSAASLDLTVRTPVQERSRRRWATVLDAGVALIEEGGAEALTISAVCERAEVPPRFIYERVSNKEALFLAVYEHGMARVRESESGFDRADRWIGLSRAATVDAAVRELVAVFERNRAFLRSIVLVSGARGEVRARGAQYTGALRTRFVGRLAVVSDDTGALDAVFRVLFSSLVFRTAYGPDFVAPPVSDAQFADELVQLSLRALGVTP
jgi:AcrR family transcriptional regulator